MRKLFTFLFAALMSVSMSWATTTDLASITDNYTAQDGEILTGTLGVNVKISIADGATVTLLNANINGDKTWTTGDYAGLTCLGDATITIVGTNSVSGFSVDNGYPGIYVPSGKTLIINGTGSLTAQSSTEEAAGIGAGRNTHCGNIEIQSGKITAIAGGEEGAGIGGGFNANCGNITISGGVVTAVGGYRSAGIGGGKRSGSTNAGHCGNILISGGVVSATSGEDAAAIGGGRGNNSTYKSNCGTITITNTALKVYADQGGSSTNTIGAGKHGTCGTVTIGGNTGVINDDPYTYRTKEDGEIVVDYINAIGTVVYTQECKDKIDIARELYDALEDAQKDLVSNYQTLLDAEAAYAALAPEPKYYVVGTMNSWQVNEAYEMTPNNSAGTEEYMFTMDLTTTSQFKVVKVEGENQTWIPDGLGNNYGQNGEITADGNYTIYFRPNADGGEGWFYNVIYVAKNPDPGFETVEIDFRTNPFTLISGAATLVSGTWNDKQHGYYNPVVSTALKAGNYKITVGNCQHSNQPGSVKNEDGSATLDLIDENGQTISSFTTPKNCYAGDDKVTSVWFVAEADQTIRIVCPQYTPYLKVEKVESVPEKVTVYTVTFANAEDATGIVPAAKANLAPNTVITLPKNFSMFKPGATLTAWTDGSNNFAPNTEFTVTDNVTLTAVYSDNTVTLADRKGAVTIKWLFSQSDGVPAINAQGSTTFVVAQAKVAGKTIDVQLPIDATVGKFVNSTNSWTQINPGVIFTIPSAEGAVISYKQYDNGNVTTPEINVTASEATYALTAEGTIGNLYYEYIQVVLPAPAPKYYIVGNMNEWQVDENYEMTLNSEALYEEYMFTMDLTTTDQFKVVKETDENPIYYPDGMGNNYGQNGEIIEDGNYTIYFRPDGQGGDDWFYHVIYVAKNSTTAIDNAKANAMAVKRIENGQLLIIRDGKTYTVTGQQVR